MNNNNNNNNGKNKIIVLSILVVVLGGFVAFLMYDRYFQKDTNIDKCEQSNPINEDVENKEETKKYLSYSKGQEITIAENSKWLVMEDSNENSDYVVLYSLNKYSVPNNYVETIGDEIWNRETSYDSSVLKLYVEHLENEIPITLKRVDGYKIRLLTIDDILKFDNSWVYDSEIDGYNYTGNDSKRYFSGALTMTHTKCLEGKCTAFYNVGESECYTEDCIREYWVGHWILGFDDLNVIINASKESLDLYIK